MCSSDLSPDGTPRVLASTSTEERAELQQLALQAMRTNAVVNARTAAVVSHAAPVRGRRGQAVVVSVGLAGFSGRGELAELGQQAEGALAQVVTRKTGGALAANRDAPAPKLDAREEVAEAIAAGRVELLFQKVMSVQDPSAAVQVEFMSRLANRKSTRLNSSH